MPDKHSEWYNQRVQTSIEIKTRRKLLTAAYSWKNPIKTARVRPKLEHADLTSMDSD